MLSEIDRNFDYYQKTYKMTSIFFIAPNLKESPYAKFENIKCINISGAQNKLSKLLSLIQLKWHVITNSINVIHAHNSYFDGICALYASKFLPCKYVITSHGEDIAYDKKLNYGAVLNTKVKKRIIKNLLNSSAFTTISNDMCDFASELISRDRINLIPNPIPPNELVESNTLESEVKKIKKQYNINDELLFLTLSGARPIKGHENMLIAFSKFLQVEANSKLFIAAHGPHTKVIKKQVKSLGIEDNVYFIGFVEGGAKKAYFNLCHVYLNTAYFEPFGLVYLEAIQNNLANIASKNGGGKDIFTHKENGFLVDPYNFEEIYSGMVFYLNKNNRSETINNAKSQLPLYEMNKVLDKYFKVYQEVQLES